MSLKPAAKMIASGAMALRRRSAIERRTLQLIRAGGEEDSIDPDFKRDRFAVPSGENFGFSELRAAAIASGLDVQPVGAPYLSGDELLLLGWLAQGQRTATPWLVAAHDRALRSAVDHTAGALAKAGARLASTTIYAARSLL